MSEPTQRLIQCFKLLYDQGKVKSGRDFALSLEYHAQTWSSIQKGKREAPLDLIHKACTVYGLSPTFILLGQDEPFLHSGDKKRPQLLSIITDSEGNERIAHVPVAAQAGYPEGLGERVFMQDLPTFSLPDFRFKRGTHRCFDIQGDSMEPVLYEGDQVVCSFVERDFWKKNIAQNQVHVIVTHHEVLAKRLKMEHPDSEYFTLISDNTWYNSIQIALNDVQELWHVKVKISPFLHTPPEDSGEIVHQVSLLRDAVRAQSRMIHQLEETLEKNMRKMGK